MNGGKVIARARNRSGLTQSALADRLGTTKTAISRWEHGEVEPSFSTVARAVEACSLELSSVIAEPDLDPHDIGLIESAQALTYRQRLRRASAPSGSSKASGGGVALHPEDLLWALCRNGVRFVVFGGLAAALYGAGTVTSGMDVVLDGAPDNLSLLSSALDDLEARIRIEGIEGGLHFERDPDTLGAMNVLNLVTKYGDLDIFFHPDGVPSFAEWDDHAQDVEAFGIPFRLAALSDVIRSKETAGRPKDLISLPALRELLRRRRGRAPAKTPV